MIDRVALETMIDDAWEARASLSVDTHGPIRGTVDAALGLLDAGQARVAEPTPQAPGWRVNQWLKKAVLLSFRLKPNRIIEGGAAGAPA
ncbi:MAG: 2,3,4,5-tetrahydropyridine-2,6-dicarboxylate N-succinyltransferase, partial [Parvularculaceae bacterium]|nr:2,3,4,5-tetrahydropyridine-2,6-dicarboxylate N-succinyltransferase [Parvularculaceae bacterium]